MEHQKDNALRNETDGFSPHAFGSAPDLASFPTFPSWDELLLKMEQTSSSGKEAKDPNSSEGSFVAAALPNGGTKRERALRSGKKGNSGESAHKSPKRSRGVRIFSNVIFYMVVFTLLILTVFMALAGGGGSRPILGYSFFSVLTESMQSEIPRGSLIIVRSVDAETIEIGDDITYRISDESTVTHRVISLFENYAESGERGFETQGIENASPDPNIVYESKVVGVVVFSIPGLGFFLTFIGQNIWILFASFGLFISAFFVVRFLRKKRGGREDAYPDFDRKRKRGLGHSRARSPRVVLPSVHRRTRNEQDKKLADL